MDTSRFYSPSVLERPCPSWSSAQYFEMAETLTDKCIDAHANSHRPGTLYVGALGPLVYLRYRLAKYMKSTNVEKANRLFREALAVAENAIEQHERAHDRRRCRVSLLEGTWVGVKALECAILYHLNQSDEVGQRVSEFLEVVQEACHRLPPAECEVLYGRSGGLQAVLFLRQELNDKAIGKNLVVKLVSEIVSEGRKCSKRLTSTLPLMWEWHDQAYLGAAHGVVGICQTLLSLQPDEFDEVDRTLNVNARELIRETIVGLEEHSFSSGNLQSSIDSPRDKLVHWCHGAPGHVMLLTKASTVFERPEYLERAKEIGDNVLMQRGLLRKGVGLCHGISGNAYALLSIGRTAKDPLWIQRAKVFAHFALDHFDQLEMVPDRPYSLFEGCGGLAVLLLDLCNPEQSAFPLYEFI